MKIWPYLKIMYWRFHIKTPFTFWDTHTLEMWKVCLQTFRNNRICKKLAYFLRKLQVSRANDSRILRIKNAKFSGYCLYMDTNIYWDFQICISVPLKNFHKFHRKIPVLESLFNKVTSLKASNFFKKGLPYRCFPVKFAKF